ncbi:hypothetical protein CFBP6600_29930 [Xanthomonas arboricola pv. corylina]|uniref:Uncharacterized protein n=1 Tax=Xanthomonas arboricola pv. corylina TaxID=487821 RepID=A0A8D6VIN3_9XANT|nr:hypothetical protein CFBP1159_15760 [Xanthomonas arboricola pv. corylina]SUZ37596.1 hypothetical protein CPBF1521_35290 [Xanthomonas arboricola pv. juglandis]CAE6746954.1 hypothetical protein CFBP1159_15760 [Xanthomonas arboricola pv. corylina]CAE6805517.1 hypothetical protein XAC301_29970 [Xanthomonas arboricola pv. corylina]CAE6805535.1 hypothetical protein XAC301_29970 [Xanthomonas arboricola pv. corylina]
MYTPSIARSCWAVPPPYVRHACRRFFQHIGSARTAGTRGAQTENGDAVQVRRRSRVTYSTTTGILPMRDCHCRGPVLCTDSPVESTATVTGMSLTSNS